MRQRLSVQHKIRHGFLVLALSPLAGFFAASAGNAQTVEIGHCDGQCPVYEASMNATRSTVVVHNLYAAGLNGDTGMADWVAYRLVPEAVGPASLLPRQWQPDRLIGLTAEADRIQTEELDFALVELGTPSVSPYGGVNEAPVDREDRARLAPMTSFAKTPFWPELNNVSNMVPMPGNLRKGPWLQLEQTLNRHVQRHDAVNVVSGPLYIIGQLSTNLSRSQLNPAAYFKVVISGDQAATFVFPHDMAQYDHFCNARASLSDVEAMSGLQLAPGRKLAGSSSLYASLGCDQAVGP